MELKLFTRQSQGRLTDAESKALTDYVAVRPDAGDLIPDAGGARKLRWSASGHGKSGGARVITYWHCAGCPAYLLFIYLKNERENLSRSEIARLRSACKELADAHR